MSLLLAEELADLLVKLISALRVDVSDLDFDDGLALFGDQAIRFEHLSVAHLDGLTKRSEDVALLVLNHVNLGQTTPPPSSDQFVLWLPVFLNETP